MMPAKIPLSVALQPSPSPARLPLPLYVGKAPAGFPSPAMDHMDQQLDLIEYLVLHPTATFFMRVKGDSMIGAGIHNGDMLVVDRSLEPVSGRVVVATLNDELTVKRLHRYRGQITLKAENPAYPDIPVKEGQELKIWGVVAHVIHQP